LTLLAHAPPPDNAEAIVVYTAVAPYAPALTLPLALSPSVHAGTRSMS